MEAMKLNIFQEEYDEIQQEFGDYKFNQYCIVVRKEDGATGVFGEFESPKKAAEYYDIFLSHAIDKKDVTVQMLTMVSRLNDNGDCYKLDTDFMTHEKND